MGEWYASNYWGVWENLGYRFPRQIIFNDCKKSFIYTKRSIEQDFTILDFAGYWIGGTATGRYTLHFICRREYDSSYTGLSTVNFVIKSFDGSTLTIETYDGNGGATFSKNDSGVDAISADPLVKEKEKTYNLNGVEVSNSPAPGIYIRGREKVLIK
ncbi:MAG: hypothetical protein Q4F07_07545 [Bacteroidales bacterium]|nr:hypothetical protein [Bacteroidales bacterium]